MTQQELRCLALCDYRSIEADKYELRLSYEAVREWLGQPVSDLRKELAWLLSEGIRKPQSAWTNVGTDKELLDWIHWLYDLQAQEYPNLWIVGKRSTGKGGKVSPWIERPFTRPGHSFCLRLKLGVKPNGDGWGSRPHLSAVDLHINGAALGSSFLLPKLRMMTGELSLNARETGKSLAIGKDVPLVREKVYDPASAIECLKAAQEIQDWFEKNERPLLKLLGSNDG